ncbi:MAG: hypothetical protein KME15_14430 [Drouetiella hepatica Uher 2000/2452]|jgi:hypothetical protein|uniref:Uncharacterized protein n=1 Tax=Drouetiella hepatica Uher 2000/2452 TaxID=904376 RepID=A0A951UNH0_9CYAN|nr:hypothetical protein [Drouetiella hepatica Uher 2000/2452]
MIIWNTIVNARKLAGSVIIGGLLCLPLVPTAARAGIDQAPMLLAQEQNVRIATLQCGGYTITIRTEGSAASDSYSYLTDGLFLTNGTRDGETYLFYNNDYEYKVVTQGGGSGSLTVSHYGETMMTKQCTWS